MARYASRFTRYEVRKISYEKIKLFLQNEPNFRKSQMNLSNYMTINYVQMDTWSIRKNEPKTNPNEPKTKPILANKTPIRTKTNPNKPNFAWSLPTFQVGPKILVSVFGSCYNASQKILISQGSERPGVRPGPSWELTLWTCSGQCPRRKAK
jgi:hypothetical protein